MIDALNNDWDALKAAMDSGCRALVSGGSTARAPRTRPASNMQVHAMRFERNFKFLIARIVSRRKEETDRADALEADNNDMFERLITLRHSTPASLRLASMRCRAEPRVMSSYGIDFRRRTTVSVPNTLELEIPEIRIDADDDDDEMYEPQQQQQYKTVARDVENPVVGRPVSKARYRKKVKPVVITVDASAAPPP